MTEGQELVITQPPENIASVEPVKPVEGSSYQRFLAIVTGRLERIAQPPLENQQQPKSNEQNEQENTARALLSILKEESTPMESFTTTLKPTEKPSTQETTSPQQETPQKSDVAPSEQPQPSETPQLLTYTNVKVDYENNIVTATDPSGKEVSFPLSDLAADMAKTTGLPEHQVELIISHLSKKEINLAETVRSFGFLTDHDIFDIFGIPKTYEERKKALQNEKLPQWQRELITAIDKINLDEIPTAQQIIEVFSSAGIPTDQPIEKAVKTIQKHVEKLPPEQKEAYKAYIEKLSKALGETTNTLAAALENHYRKLEAGEEVNDQETRQIIETLLTIETVKKNFSEEKRKEILNKAAKLGKGVGIIMALLSILIVWQSARELSGSKHQ